WRARRKLEVGNDAGRTARNHGIRAQGPVLVLRANGFDQWFAEVLSHQSEFMYWNQRQQPHDQEKGHHGCHEVSVCDLPAASVWLLVMQFLAPDDDARFPFAHAAVSRDVRPRALV